MRKVNSSSLTFESKIKIMVFKIQHLLIILLLNWKHFKVVSRLSTTLNPSYLKMTNECVFSLKTQAPMSEPFSEKVLCPLAFQAHNCLCQLPKYLALSEWIWPIVADIIKNHHQRWRKISFTICIYVCSIDFNVIPFGNLNERINHPKSPNITRHENHNVSTLNQNSIHPRRLNDATTFLIHIWAANSLILFRLELRDDHCSLDFKFDTWNVLTSINHHSSE